MVKVFFTDFEENIYRGKCEKSGLKLKPAKKQIAPE